MNATKQTTLLNEPTTEPAPWEAGLGTEPLEGHLIDEQEPSTALVARDISPMSLIETAITAGATDQIEKLLALQERYEANQARKLYHEAMAKFREIHVVVLRSAEITDGPLKGKTYAKLIDFVGAAAPALSSCGLSATWEVTKDEKDWIEVACVISHVAGHQTRTMMGGPPDSGGAKNAIQARASTVSYLQKYTFKMAVGLAEQSDDNDGNGSPPDSFIDEKQVASIEAELKRMPPDVAADARASMFAWAEITETRQLPLSKYGQAMSALMKRSAKYNP